MGAISSTKKSSSQQHRGVEIDIGEIVNNLIQEIIDSVIYSMPNRIQALLEPSVVIILVINFKLFVSFFFSKL